MNEARNEAIIERAAMGWHLLDIAADMRLSPSTVNGVLCRWRAAGRRRLIRPAPDDPRRIAVVMERMGLSA